MAERKAGIQTSDQGPGQAWIPDQVRDEKIYEGMVVSFRKPLQISISDGGNAPKTLTTTAETVDDLLREQKIALAATDRVVPSEAVFLTENLTVQIDRIVDLEVTESAQIPYDIVLEHDPSSYYGREEVRQAGVSGKKEQKFLITYKNGVEIKRRKLSETILQKPKPELRRFGTRIEVEQTEEGRASWYAYKDCLCAAHPSYQKGRFVRVTAVSGPNASVGAGKSIIVKINDRGPDRSIYPDRVIDLDSTAFKQLAPLGSGTVAVRVELLR